MPDKDPFPLDWLRHTSPYINTHRGRTFVVWFDGETVQSASFANLVNDLTLLSHLGIKLVLVHGMRPQIDRELAATGLTSEFENRVRITASDALPGLHGALGKVRCAIESAFSTGLPNTPMSGAQVTLCSGNLVIAKPYGVRNGIDFGHTGEVRRIRTRTIRQLLDMGTIVLLSPVGYSPTGEMFNLHAEEIASQAAIELQADKLIYLHSDSQAFDTQLGEIAAASYLRGDSEIPSSLADLQHFITLCADACDRGVARAHLVSSRIDGALLKELFTRDGGGLMVHSGTYDSLRRATSADVSGIYDLIEPLVREGILVERSEQDLERSIAEYYVAERDGTVIACASLTVYQTQAELGCLAVHPDFRASGKAGDILRLLIERARDANCTELFALTTRSPDWFRQHGFTLSTHTDLPPARNRQDAISRGSKVLRLRL
jgi:amino-acid N-acetyltransferase